MRGKRIDPTKKRGTVGGGGGGGGGGGRGRRSGAKPVFAEGGFTESVTREKEL